MIEPAVIKWPVGRASLGYLGDLRWRVRIDSETVDEVSIATAVQRVFAAVFAAVPPGEEAASRSPIELNLPNNKLFLLRDERMVNGWRFVGSEVEGDVGPHEQLVFFVAERIAAASDKVWAKGIRPVQQESLGSRFSFKKFKNADNAENLCHELQVELTKRIRAHPSPATAFVAAMQELKLHGHDLWSYTPGEVWGPDYVKRRKGAGLFVQRFTSDDAEDDDGDTVEAETVSVTFTHQDDRGRDALEKD